MNETFQWTGRCDPEDGDHTKRWHQIVRSDTNGTAGLIGFNCDLGVNRNKGRIGAAAGPNAIRTALANLAWHGKEDTIVDFGNVGISKTDKDSLEHAQDHLGNAIQKALHATSRVFVLGGGHETAAGSFNGLDKYLTDQPEKQIGIINLDAHFDLRKPAELGISSGTPFYQIYHTLKETNRKMNYLCLGISETSNTKALFERAEQWGVQYMLDRDVRTRTIDQVYSKIDIFLESCDVLYLTIDLDVLPYWQMPAVSSPAAYGVDIKVIEDIINHLEKTTKAMNVEWLLSDMVEFNPNFDQDNCGAKVAARLCDKVIRAMI